MMRVGVFLGGSGTRMGGVCKALLPLPSGESILRRTLRIIGEAGLEPVLLGPTPAILAALDGQALPESVPDAAPNSGPLGGLVSLLDLGPDPALAVAGDMPFITAQLLTRLQTESLRAAILAPRSGAYWEPLCARYDSRAVAQIARRRLEARELSLQGLLNEVGAVCLSLDNQELLRDWDTPADMGPPPPQQTGGT